MFFLLNPVLVCSMLPVNHCFLGELYAKRRSGQHHRVIQSQKRVQFVIVVVHASCSHHLMYASRFLDYIAVRFTRYIIMSACYP